MLAGAQHHCSSMLLSHWYARCRFSSVLLSCCKAQGHCPSGSAAKAIYLLVHLVMHLEFLLHSTGTAFDAVHRRCVAAAQAHYLQHEHHTCCAETALLLHKHNIVVQALYFCCPSIVFDTLHCRSAAQDCFYCTGTVLAAALSCLCCTSIVAQLRKHCFCCASVVIAA